MYIALFFLQSYVFDQSILRPMGEAAPRLGGFTINPNVLAYTLLLLLSSILNIKFLRPILFIISTYLLVLCFTRSAFIIYFMIIIFLIKKKSLFFLSIIALIVSGIILLFGNFDVGIISYVFTRGHDVSNVMTLGGRTDIWSLMLDNLPDSWNILWGHGFQMVSRFGLSAESSTMYASMAHNNFLQSLLGLGIFGLLITISFWILAFIELSNYTKGSNNFHQYIMSTYYISFGFSIVEFGIFGVSTIITWIFFIVIFACNRSQRLHAPYVLNK